MEEARRKHLVAVMTRLCPAELVVVEVGGVPPDGESGQYAAVRNRVLDPRKVTRVGRRSSSEGFVVPASDQPAPGGNRQSFGAKDLGSAKPPSGGARRLGTSALKA